MCIILLVNFRRMLSRELYRLNEIRFAPTEPPDYRAGGAGDLIYSVGATSRHQVVSVRENVDGVGVATVMTSTLAYVIHHRRRCRLTKSPTVFSPEHRFCTGPYVTITFVESNVAPPSSTYGRCSMFGYLFL